MVGWRRLVAPFAARGRVRRGAAQRGRERAVEGAGGEDAREQPEMLERKVGQHRRSLPGPRSRGALARRCGSRGGSARRAEQRTCSFPAQEIRASSHPPPSGASRLAAWRGIKVRSMARREAGGWHGCGPGAARLRAGAGATRASGRPFRAAPRGSQRVPVAPRI